MKNEFSIVKADPGWFIVQQWPEKVGCSVRYHNVVAWKIEMERGEHRVTPVTPVVWYDRIGDIWGFKTPEGLFCSWDDSRQIRFNSEQELIDSWKVKEEDDE